MRKECDNFKPGLDKELERQARNPLPCKGLTTPPTGGGANGWWRG
ncbi:MAG: hypothetical protein ACYSW3_04990 [Planctomycetota bacterium]